MYRINRFLIRSYKLKMNFYRVPRSEFDDNYMIRLVNRHFLFPKTTYIKSATRLRKSSPQKVKLKPLKRKGKKKKAPELLILPKKIRKRKKKTYRGTLHSRQKVSKRGLKHWFRRSKNLSKSYEIKGNFYQSAKFYSTLSSETLYHGVTHYNRKRYKRLRVQKNLLRYVHKTLTLRQNTAFNNLFSYENPKTKFKLPTTRLLNDLSVLKNAKLLPFFTINYLFFKTPSMLTSLSIANRYTTLVRPIEREVRLNYLAPNPTTFHFSNLTPYISTRQIITRKLLKLFKFHKFTPGVTM